MATATNDVDEIRRQMGLIRRELHQDVRQVVEQAEAVTDWQRYIRLYPWVALGAAFGLGYVIVPKRKRPVPHNVATVADVAEVREALKETRKEDRKKQGLVMATWAMISPIAIRLAQSYAVQYLENWLLQQQQAAAAGGPPPRQPSGPGRARGPAGY